MDSPGRRLLAVALRCLLASFLLLTSLGATPIDLNEAGKTAYSRGDYTAAERLFSQAIAQAPGDPLLHYHRAVALTRLEHWREAAREYEAVLRLGPPASLAEAAREGLRGITPLSRRPPPKATRATDTEIPLQRGPGGWVTEAVVNDGQTARFLVDTGASVTVISPRLARALAILPAPDAQAVELETLSGRTRALRLTIASLRVGDTEATNVLAVVHETASGVDGILGNSFLSRYIVTLDPARGVLALRPR